MKPLALAETAECGARGAEGVLRALRQLEGAHQLGRLPGKKLPEGETCRPFGSPWHAAAPPLRRASSHQPSTQSHLAFDPPSPIKSPVDYTEADGVSSESEGLRLIIKKESTLRSRRRSCHVVDSQLQLAETYSLSPGLIVFSVIDVISGPTRPAPSPDVQLCRLHTAAMVTQRNEE
ncbi:hypothetical protein EYF80_046373 [Liparis tanakae]|uniref:Uncharacterized protein n=1 Tax=Liparis tanakae TaxID=230148 RepID=A0A4Z2FRV6_9TELE|nr:hypothetical protein EYF80_046373 [Liparis tanakae]